MHKFAKVLGLIAVMVIAGLVVVLPVLNDAKMLPSLISRLHSKSGIEFTVQQGAYWTAPTIATETTKLVGDGLDVQLWVFATAQEAEELSVVEPGRLVRNGRVLLVITLAPPTLVDAFLKAPL